MLPAGSLLAPAATTEVQQSEQGLLHAMRLHTLLVAEAEGAAEEAPPIEWYTDSLSLALW